MIKVLVTGGAGFISSHLVTRFVKTFSDYQIINLDKLTYAGNLSNLIDIDQYDNYRFIKGDILDADFIEQLFARQNFDAVIHWQQNHMWTGPYPAQLILYLPMLWKLLIC